MNDVISVSKKLPLSVSLGAIKVFSLLENLQSDLLTNLSYNDKQSFFFEQENFVLVCGNKVKRPKVSQPNDIQMALIVRRALALKNHTKKAVLLVVNNKYEGELIAKKFNNYASCFKVYTSNKNISAKLHEDICAEFQNEANFEVITYDNLWGLVTRKAKTKTELDFKIERIPKTEQIIFVNPLRKRFHDKDLARLDAITRCLLSHKYKEPAIRSFLMKHGSQP